jgi:hypothetical protein
MSTLRIFALLWLCIASAASAARPAKPASEGVPNWMVSLDPKDMTAEQRTDILIEEKRQRKRLAKLSDEISASDEKSELSKIPALQDLGRIVYKLEKLEDALEISRDVARIYTGAYGAVDRRSLSAIINVASTLFKMGQTEECHLIMTKVFPIQLGRYDLGSKEVSYHIGKMRIFGIPEEDIGSMVATHQAKRKNVGAGADGLHSGTVQSDGSVTLED